MTDPVASLVLDLLEWIGPDVKPYAEVMDAWRTSCPRLPVWEEANARGYLACSHREGVGQVVAVTPTGWAHLEAQGRTVHSAASGPDLMGEGHVKHGQ